MGSDFSLVCPFCKKACDFVGDDWHDELTDDSEDHDIPCLHCGEDIRVRVNATYSIEPIPDEADE